MKKLRKLLAFVMFFSCLGNIIPWGSIQAFAEKKDEVMLIDNDQLRISYEAYSEKAENVWQINTERIAKYEGQEQRLKFKLLTDNNQKIDYPQFEGIVEQDGWLLEKEFSEKAERKLTFKLPESQKKLQLYIQLDEQERDKDGKLDAKENILEKNEPYVLELKESKKDEQGDKKGEDSNSPSYPEQNGGTEKAKDAGEYPAYPQLQGSQIARADFDVPKAITGAGLGENRYENKAPTYLGNETSATGKYPENSWTPSQQTNVINHQGGVAGQSGWDNNQGWNVNVDNHTNSYINYGDPSKPNVALRKYAKETSENDKFTVRLNVLGNTVQRPGVDIYFILDNSASMSSSISGSSKTKKKITVDYLAALIKELQAQQKASGSPIQVGGHIFSDYQMGGSTPIMYNLSSNPSEWDNIVNRYSSMTPTGNTYTQRALIETYKYLLNTDKNRRKVLFVLTDGGPTLSASPLSAAVDNDMYYDKVFINNFDLEDPNFKTGYIFQPYIAGQGPYITKFTKPYPIRNTGISINSHITTTNSTAKTLKGLGYEMHTVGLDIKNPAGEIHSVDEILKGLQLMSSKKTNAAGEDEKDYFFHKANSENDLDSSFKEWFATVVQTVHKGVITDPLGDMVDLVGDKDDIHIKEITKSGVPAIEKLDKATASYDPKTRTISVNNINLYGNQEIEIEYDVRLKTDKQSGFVQNKWYPANGRTILEPTPEISGDKLDFGVPSVRAKTKDFVIPVEKKWSDDHNSTAGFWKDKRPSSITAALEKKNGNSWEAAGVPNLTLNEGNSWKESFEAVEGGAGNTYRVVEKIGSQEKVPGYGNPAYNQTSFTSETSGFKGVVITNTILKTNYSFKKVKDTESNLFTGDAKDKPKFKVTTAESPYLEVAKDLTPGSNGMITVSGLPVGRYRVTETWAPSDFTLADDFFIDVTEKNGSLVATVNGSEEAITVYNHFKKFEFSVKKIWSDSRNGTADFWKKRPTEITAVLQKQNGTKWSDVKEIKLEAKTGWTGRFKDIDSGAENKYRVIERIGSDKKERVPSYGEPIYNEPIFDSTTLTSDGVTITNKLLTTDYTFKKVGNTQDILFTGNDKPKFTITTTDTPSIEVAKDVSPGNDGLLTVSGLPVGRYKVTETHAPNGYTKADDFYIDVTEKTSGELGVVAKVNGKEGQVTIYNRLEDYTLTVKKKDDQGGDLKGATFKLTQTNGGTYEKEIEGGPTFEFAGLKSGRYRLEETKVPKSYRGLPEAVTLEIKDDGTVVSPKNPLITDTVSGNKIEWLVKNTPIKGTLPTTGSFGNRLLFKIAFVLAFIGGGVGIVNLYIEFKRRTN